MDYECIEVERGGEVAVVTFNRPEKANALNHRHIEEIEHAALGFRDDETARVVIFTGAGKHFNSGADLTAKDPEHALLTVRRRRRRIGLKSSTSSPSIAWPERSKLRTLFFDAERKKKVTAPLTAPANNEHLGRRADASLNRGASRGGTRRLRRCPFP